MRVYLVDGTYELFRHYFAVPGHVTADGVEVGAARAAAGSILDMLERGATHLGVATDKVIRSFRNRLWAGYKTEQGVPADLLSQFPLFEHLLAALGIVVWPMVELEADDALAAAARIAAQDPDVEQVLICTPDKDLGQCVVGTRVVQLDRRRNILLDEAGVTEKFGVPPASIPDYLALVGDSADGYPGLPGFGARTAAALLRKFGRLEEIPLQSRHWPPEIRSAPRLAATLVEDLKLVLLFRDLATLRESEPLFASVDELHWQGPKKEVDEVCKRLDSEPLAQRARRLAERRK